MAEKLDPKAVFVMSQVNRAFHHLTSTSPSLWTNIDFLDGLTNTKRKLQMSGQVPLSVDMDAVVFNWLRGSKADEQFDELLNLIVSHKERVKKTSCCAGTRPLITRADAQVHGRGLDVADLIHRGRSVIAV